jgi:hypothetical protein
VYRENQRLSIDRLPIENETVWSDDDLELSVAETPASGPVKINATDSDGEATNATVSVDGTEVGDTGEDGTL